MNEMKFDKELRSALLKLIAADSKQIEGIKITDVQVSKEPTDNGWSYSIRANVNVTNIEPRPD